ncbi:MAG: DUF1254 domain-containing protein [Alphaproteobacteria bacterium]
MRLTLIGALVLFLLAAAAGHAVMLTLIPMHATDAQIENYKKKGRPINVLFPSGIKTAATSKVPRDNGDTNTLRVIFDFSKGGFILEGPMPKNAAYWSSSMFAHNTDTDFIISDRQITGDHFKIAFIGPHQKLTREVAPIVARSSSRTAIMIVRSTMPDRNDAAKVAALMDELKQVTLTPIPADALAPAS